MLRVTGEETRDEALQDVDLLERVPPRGKGSKEESKARSPLAEERPAIERQRPAPQEDQHPAEAKTREKPRKSFLRRHPVASALGAILAAAAMGAGYTYFDYTQHFQSTDDAFIAARQTALAPKVAGYVTQVAVTDNEHVPAGGVIARIDDRDYRIALEQAKAQVAAAEASIRNIDAQMRCPGRPGQGEPGSSRSSAGGADVCEAAGGPLRGLARKGSGTFECPAIRLPASAAGCGPQEREAALTVAQRQIDFR